MSDETSETKPKKRVATKRGVAKPRAKRAATKKPARKAPTKQTAPVRSVSTTQKWTAVIILAFIVIFAVSAFIGFSDKGEINVRAIVDERVATLDASGRSEESAAIRGVGAASNNPGGPPNDGLVGRGNKITEQQLREQQERENTSETASSSATSTDASATSTEPVTDEAEETKDETATSSAPSADTPEPVEATETPEASATTTDPAA